MRLHSSFYWTPCEHFPLLNLPPEESEKVLVSRTDWLRGRITWRAVPEHKRNVMESPLLLAQTATKALTGLSKKIHKTFPYLWHNLQVAEMPAFAGRYFVFLVPGNISTHFSEGRTRTLPGRLLCPCCDPAAAHSIFGCLFQGTDSKMRQGTVHPLPTNLWQTLIHCIHEPGPVPANGFDLAAFIHTLPLCERSKVQNMGQLWPELQAHFRSQAFCFSGYVWELKRDPVH